MTYEELKAEASRQGYSLIRKEKYVHLLKCPQCGKKPSLWNTPNGFIYRCDCGVEGERCKTLKMAKLSWNKGCGNEEVRS